MLSTLRSLIFFLLTLCFSISHAEEMTVWRARSILGVSASADLAQVRAERNRLLKKYHPDLVGREGEAKSKEINAAFNCLKKWFAGEQVVMGEAPKPESETPKSSSGSRGESELDEEAKANAEPVFFWDPVARTFQLEVAFSHQDVTERTRNYKKLLEFFSNTVIHDLDRATEFPLKNFGHGPIEARLKSLKHFRTSLIFGGLSVSTSMLSSLIGAPEMIPLAVLGSGEVAYQIRSRHVRAQAKELAEVVSITLGTLRNDLIEWYPYEELLFSYDLVENLAQSNLAVSIEDPWFYYSQLLPVLESIPESLPGFLLRASAGQGIAGRLSQQLKFDIRARPVFWRRVFEQIPYFKLPGEYRKYVILQELYDASEGKRWLPDLHAYAEMKWQVLCEKIF